MDKPHTDCMQLIELTYAILGYSWPKILSMLPQRDSLKACVKDAVGQASIWTKRAWYSNKYLSRKGLAVGGGRVKVWAESGQTQDKTVPEIAKNIFKWFPYEQVSVYLLLQFKELR